MGNDPHADSGRPPEPKARLGARIDEVLERYRGAPHVDHAQLRTDIDRYASQDPTPRSAGKLRNELWMADDFDETPAEFLEDLDQD